MNIIAKMNRRAKSYINNGMSIDTAIKQAVSDYVEQLHGISYRIMSKEEIETNNRHKLFEPYGKKE